MKFKNKKTGEIQEFTIAEVDSSSVSAQSRKRLYWTNIPFTNNIIDRRLVLDDILDPQPRESDILTHPWVKVDGHKSSNGLKFIGGFIRESGKSWGKSKIPTQSSFSQGYRIYDSSGKAPTLTANSGGKGNRAESIMKDGVIRKLNRTEREKLQTLPVGYTSAISESKAFTAIGNGWTVDIIAEIFRGLSV